MKKNLLCCATILALIPFTSHAAVDPVVEPAWGPADTVECHMVGPGINYTKIIYPDVPVILWYTEIDITNEYNKIEQVQSRHAVPDVLRWDVMTHYKENSRPGHQVKVAWNHDFFSYDAGICIGANISDGEMTWTKWGRSLIAITKDKKAEVFNPNAYVAEVLAGDGTKVWIDRYNAAATSIEGECILFNRFNSLNLNMEGKYIKIAPQGEWLVNGAPIPCKVLEISNTPLQTSATEYVIFLRGGKLNALDGHANVGDILNISQWFDGAKWGTPPANILNAFHGYPSIARNGQFHDGEYNNFENGREYEKSSHVMVGINKEKNKLLVLINEMSGQSQAVDCVQLTSWMINRGAWDVVNFDSGGSAAIVIDEEMLNLPGRGSIRPVQDAMLAVSLAPEDNTIHHYSFSKPTINPSVISVTPLRLLGFNQYDEVLDKDVTGFTFTCEPAELGYVDESAIFHSSSKAIGGKIIAEKDGKRAEIQVSTRAAGNVHPRLSNIIIDGHRQYLLEIIGETATEKFNLDPLAFTWEASNANCIVENGMLKGLNEGTSVLTATFEDITFNINVTVEKAQDLIVLNDFSDLTTLSPAYSGVKNMAKADNLPEGWSDGATYKFDISSSRAPYIKFAKPIVAYSLPDSISFQMNDASSIVSSINTTYEDNLGTKYTKSFQTIAKTDDVYVIPFIEETKSVYEIGKYPITLKTIQVNLKNSINGTGKELSFRNLVAHYPKGSGSVDNIQIGNSEKVNPLIITTSPETVTATFDASSDCKAEVSMFSTTGMLLSSTTHQVAAGTNSIEISTKEAPCGVYIIMVSLPGSTLSAKYILR